jgi:Fe-S-cluster containining protein
MISDYKTIIGKAEKAKKENKIFLEKLKKLAPKDLDIFTNQIHDRVFEKIDCLQCANCCASTGPLLLNKDIERLAKALKIRPSIFAEQYLKIDEDNDYVFKQMPCTFLGNDKYCSVYSDRPNACREFPHTQQRNVLQKLKITFLNTTICPAVAMVVDGLKEKYKI